MQRIIIIGSGVVGLATAYKISKNHPDSEIHVLEKEERIAPHQSTHNSGVIHSGIYYKPGSLKARNCILGYRQLIDFSREYGIEYDICGKLILAATEEQLTILDSIYSNGVKNGLEGLKMIGRDEIREIEPYAEGVQAIYVPQTGIIDFADVAAELVRQIEQNRGQIHLNFKVEKIESSDTYWNISSGDSTISGDLVIFCGGLHADKLAKMAGLEVDLQIIPFRGEYYELKPASEYLVKHLIYPVPDPAFPFLGVHFTRRIKGGIESGPNAVLALKREGYSRWQLNVGEVAEIFAYRGFRKLAGKYWKTGIGEFKRSFSKSAYLRALQDLIPEISSEDIYRGRSGVRAMACRSNGEMIDDFHIKESQGMIHVLNAPSPAATSCLAIGDHIAGLAKKQLQ